jgi:hypothetical protein
VNGGGVKSTLGAIRDTGAGSVSDPADTVVAALCDDSERIRLVGSGTASPDALSSERLGSSAALWLADSSGMASKNVSKRFVSAPPSSCVFLCDEARLSGSAMVCGAESRGTEDGELSFGEADC